MCFGELLADRQPVALAANDGLAQEPLLVFDAVAAAKATAVVEASDGTDNDVRGEWTSNDSFGGNSK